MNKNMNHKDRARRYHKGNLLRYIMNIYLNKLHNDGLDTSDLISVELYDINFIAFLLYLCYSLDESFKNSLENYINRKLYII